MAVSNLYVVFNFLRIIQSFSFSFWGYNRGESIQRDLMDVDAEEEVELQRLELLLLLLGLFCYHLRRLVLCFCMLFSIFLQNYNHKHGRIDL